MIQKGQIALFAGNFVPFGFAKCDGKNGTPNLPPLVYNKDAKPLPYLIATDNIDDYFMGMILLTGFTSFTPEDWLPCDGRLLNVAENAALYSILSSTYGGAGYKTFALPNIANAKNTYDRGAIKYIICERGSFPRRP